MSVGPDLSARMDYHRGLSLESLKNILQQSYTNLCNASDPKWRSLSRKDIECRAFFYVLEDDRILVTKSRPLPKYLYDLLKPSIVHEEDWTYGPKKTPVLRLVT